MDKTPKTEETIVRKIRTKPFVQRDGKVRIRKELQTDTGNFFIRNWKVQEFSGIPKGVRVRITYYTRTMKPKNKTVKYGISFEIIDENKDS